MYLFFFFLIHFYFLKKRKYWDSTFTRHKCAWDIIWILWGVFTLGLKFILYIFSSQIIFYFLYNKKNNNPRWYSRTIWYRTEVFHWTNRNMSQTVHCWDRGYQNGALWREEREVENPKRNAKLWPSRFGNLRGGFLLKRTLYSMWVFLPVPLIWHVEFSL